MAKQLPIVWSEVEKAALAGVPMYEIARKLVENTPALQENGVDKLYATIRKRASRERWPLPDAIVRRAQAQARLAAGVAADAKQAAGWQKGTSGLDAVQLSREAAGLGVPQHIVDGISGELAGGVSLNAADVAGGAGGLVGEGAVGGLTTSPVTAENLVTQDLVTLGQRGLRAILNRATLAAEAMTEAPEVRSWNDVQVMTKVISQAAGLDKPQVAIAVSLNSGINSGIAGWECAESIDTIAERVG
jgi:hypothetical protein